MEKLILKTALAEDQILARNNMDCDAIEIQMFDIDEPLDNIKKSTKPIHTIHIPFIDEYCHLNCLIETDISKLRNVFYTAIKYNAGIVMHCSDIPFEDLPLDKLKKFINLVDEYPNLKIGYENTTMFNTYNIDTTIDVVRETIKLNQMSKYKHFYPLLDICHAVSNMNRQLHYPGYDLAMLLSWYNSEWYNIHFNYAYGNGSDERHGVSFDGNPELLREILDYFATHDLHPNLILEVQESDYIKCENGNNLAKAIRKICEE